MGAGFYAKGAVKIAVSGLACSGSRAPSLKPTLLFSLLSSTAALAS